MSILPFKSRTAIGVHAEIAGPVLADSLFADQVILEFLDTDRIGLQSMRQLRFEFALAADAGVHVVGCNAHPPTCGHMAIAHRRH